MQTRFTRAFGVEKPLACPGMSWIATPELVAAVANAGGLGILATGPLDAAATRRAIRRIRELTDKPFGIGCTLMMPGARENCEVALDEQVPVINFSLGKGDWIVKRAHAYGGKVIATVTTEKHAASAAASGVDGLLVTGHEAAAHGGNVTSLVLIPAIRKITDLPILAAGGFGTGQGLLAALALGADAVAMGTRLASTRESPVHDRTKDLIRKKTVQDTIYSANFDGLPCRVMTTPMAKQVTRKPLGLIRAGVKAMQNARAMKVSALQVLGGLVKAPQQIRQLAQFGAATEQIRLAIQDGNHEKGVQLIGQVQGLIDDTPSVAELFERIMHEAAATRESLAQL